MHSRWFVHRGFSQLAGEAENYAELLRKCSREKNLALGRRIHRQIIGNGYDKSRNLGNLLVQMYGKCKRLEEANLVFEKIPNKTALSWNIMAAAYAQNGHLQEARALFDRTPTKSISSWNAMITAYVQAGLIQDATHLFQLMQEKNEVSWNLMITAYAHTGHLLEAKKMFDELPSPTGKNWISLISGYGKIGCLDEARVLFDRMPDKDIAARTALVSAYALNGHLDEASRMFEERASEGDVGSWNTIIWAYLQFDRIDEACAYFRRMDLEGIRSERSTFINILAACAQFSLQELGRSIHSKMVELHIESDIAVSTALLKMYGKCGDLESVKSLFMNMMLKDVVAWTAVVSAFGQNELIDCAREVFNQMPQWNLISWTAIITANAEAGYLQEAVCLYNEMPQQNRVSLTAILAGYARNGYLEDARMMFDAMCDKDVVSWTAMINAHVENFQDTEAVQLFRIMDLEGGRPNRTTFLAVLEACANIGCTNLGRIIHGCIMDSGCQAAMMIPSALLNMYGKCGSISEVKDLFDSIPNPDMVSRNALLVGYAQNGYLNEAKEMFDSMPRRGLGCWNSMITAYAQIGDITEAETLFEQMTKKDVVTWTGMIKVYAQAGYSKKAFEFLLAMDLNGVRPNKVTFLHVCEVTALMSSSKMAELVHKEIMNTGLRADAVLGTSILAMYGRCGGLENAKSFFDQMLRRYVEPWNALLGCYSQNGLASQVLGLFHTMVLDGLRPNTNTFVNVLAASSHGGTTEDGHQCFVTISGDYGLQPTIDHYVCMVDILARAGRLKDAEDLIQHMPYEPEALAWTSLLGACSVNSDTERADRAAQHAFKLDPGNSAPYALLSSVYKQEDG